MSFDPSKKKNTLFAAIALVGTLFFLEMFASSALMLRMRLAKSENFTKSEPTYFSLLNIPGLFDRRSEYRITTEPKPRSGPDLELGYRLLPGKYQDIFSRRSRGRERLPTNVTIRNDGTRWTGECEPSSSTVAYIFGDSWVFGTGVNDEQTFAFLLQLARKDMCVKLFAVEGYGMTQSFIQFHKLVDRIKPNDIVILGYADYFDVRNVAAPSRLRLERDWHESHGLAEESKADLDDLGAIRISYVQRRCDENGGYCDRNDPARDEMSRITAALINGIAETSSAPVYLLHFDGSKKNPIFGRLSDTVRRISALEEDFGLFQGTMYWALTLIRGLIGIMQ
jgi:hypothetical protein